MPAVKTKTSAPEPAVERIIPVIDVEKVYIHHSSEAHSPIGYKTVIVLAPDDLTLDDIGNHPEIWKKLQLNRTGKALCDEDKVEIRSFAWTIYAVVDHADTTGVQLYKKWDKREKRARDRRPWSDENYYVGWTKDGYTYFRKSDDQALTQQCWDRWQSARDACSREMYSPRLV